MTAITVVGNLGRADLRFTPAGKAVLNLSVAVNRRKFDRATNEWTDAGTDWHDVTIWDAKAEVLAEHLAKGMRVVVVGELQSREWEKDGVKRMAWEIKASEVGVVPNGSKPTPAQQHPRRDPDPWASVPNNDEPPF